MPSYRLTPRTVSGLAGLFGLLFALSSVAIGATLYALGGAALTRGQDESIQREQVRLLAPVNGQPPDAGQVTARILARTTAREISSIGHRLVDARGNLLAGSVEIEQPSLGKRSILYREHGKKWEPARAEQFTLTDGAKLTIVSESESIEEMGKIIRPLFGTALALAIIAGVLTSVLLGRLIAARVAAIGTTAAAITAGDYSRRVAVGSLGGMFADQAQTFNRMLDRIETLMVNLRQVSSDIAHDMRTPLTRLQVKLREAGSDGIDEAARGALLAEAERECDGVLSLFAALLRIGEVESGRRRAQISSLRLDELVDDAVESYVPAFSDSNRHLVLTTCDTCSIRGDADLLNQLLVNLIENALFHTPEGSVTKVSLDVDGDDVLLGVCDNGIGIPPSDRGEVLQRFVRLERSRTTPGHGLGLALVAAIADFHDARVDLADAGPGLVVTVRFRTAPAGLHSNFAM